MPKITAIEKSYFTTNDIVNWWDPEGSEASFSEYLGATSKLKQLHADVLDDLIKNLDFEDKKVLDAGVGKGRFAVNIAKNGASDVIGLDINKKMLILSYNRIEQNGIGKKIRLIQGDIERLPMSDQKFDIVCCMETLIHVPDLNRAIKEFSRVLKNEGKLVVNVQNKKSYLGYIEYYGIIKIMQGFFNFLKQRTMIGKKNHTHLVSKKSFETMLLNSGFCIEKRINYGKYFTVLTTYICEKKGEL